MSKPILTVAASEIDRDDVTHLAVALGWIEGWTPEEWQNTFRSQRQDAGGNMYRVMSMPVNASFVQATVGMGPISRPPEDVGPPYLIDLDAAHRAQAKLAIWQPLPPDPETGEPQINPVPQADADKIVAVVGMKGTEALTAMGLESLPLDDQPAP